MKTFLIIGLLLSAQLTQASHLIGGYIQAKSISGSTITYEITTVLYTYAGSASDQMSSLTLCLGNGTLTTVTRLSQQYLQTDRSVTINIYRFVYTYPNPGTYTITTSLPGRTNVKNITNPNNLTFTLATTFTTSIPAINYTPAPDFPSVHFSTGVNQKLTVSLKATDADGDSLVYGLYKPLTSIGNDPCTHQLIPSFLFPNDVAHQGTFKLNNRTGELVWDAPAQPGNYSIVITIFEYRNSILISQTIHEITLGAIDLPGTPSTIPPYEPALEGTSTVVTAVNDYVDSDINFTAFPNPVDDLLQLVIQSSTLTTASVQLLDVKGRQVHQLQFVKPARKHEQSIDMDSLPSGVYVLRLDIDGRMVVRKIVKK